MTIVLGGRRRPILFPGLTLVEAALLGTILALTDTALGAMVGNNLKLPVRVRQTLNVESGLNDGIAVPFFLIFLELTLGEELSRPLGEFLVVALEQIGIGVIVGLSVGLLGAWCIHKAIERKLATETFSWISLVALALLAWALAHLLGGSPFIAAFVGGLASIVLVLIAMADGVTGSSFNTIRQVVILTVLLSVFLRTGYPPTRYRTATPVTRQR